MHENYPFQGPICIIDDSLIGHALRNSVIQFRDNSTAESSFSVSLLPDYLKKNSLMEQICSAVPIIGGQSSPLFFVNMDLTFKSVIEELPPGICLIEDLLCFPNSSEVKVVLYSFYHEATVRRRYQTSRIFELPTFGYIQLPFKFVESYSALVRYLYKASCNKDELESIKAGIVITRARKVSENFLGDYKHTIIDKILPNLKRDHNAVTRTKYDYLLRNKIFTLYSKEILELCGVVDDRVCAAIKEKSVLAQKCYDQKRFDTLGTLLSDTKELIQCCENRYPNPLSITLETTKNLLDKHVGDLKDILDGIWFADFAQIGSYKLADSFVKVQKRVGEYYPARAEIETLLWVLSLWMSSAPLKKKIGNIITNFLDPFFETLSMGELIGASDVFSQKMLRILDIPEDSSLEKMFNLGGV